MGNCLQIAKQIVEDAAEAQQQQQQQPSTAAPPTTSSSTALSSIYPSLPPSAESGQVRNVYDGDTLTLLDERRVRFLGIDTPEIKEHQPYAEEAKAFTKDRCTDEIWLTYEPNGEKTDHYGRLLAWVWVKTSKGDYQCVNEGIIEAGLATAYRPNSSTNFHNWSKLLALQKSARDQKRGLWSDFAETTVYKTTNGAAYHRRDCEHLASVHNLTELATSEAADAGLHPCRTCLSS